MAYLNPGARHSKRDKSKQVLRKPTSNFCQAVSIGFIAIVLIACARPADSPRQGSVLRRGLGGDPSSLDPSTAVDNFSFEVLRDLYEGLTTEAPNGQVAPGVASSWTVDETGKTYTFNLRPDARWSNGELVRAQDFVFAWRRVVDPSQASPVADDLRVIAGAAAIITGAAPTETLGVRAPTDSTLIVTLEQPAPYLPQLLTHSSAFPVHSAKDAASRSAAAWVSNGPYVLSSWSPGTSVDLAKNQNYWDRVHVHIPRVRYEIAEENSQFARYRAGELDITDTVPSNAIESLRESKSTELHLAPFLATAYYAVNLSAGPLAHSLKLRQALAMAIDRRRLVATMGFGQLPAYGFVPPGVWNYVPKAWEWREDSDLKRNATARQLYAEAGYSLSTPLRLRLLFNSNTGIKNTAIAIASMWKETLGVETILTEEEYRVFLQSRHDKARWEVARLGWTADFNDASNFLDIFRGHSSNNDFGYTNVKYDELMDAAAGTPDAGRRKALLESSEKLMLSDYPIIPLYFFVSRRLVKPYLLGFQSNPLNRVESKEFHFSGQ